MCRVGGIRVLSQHLILRDVLSGKVSKVPVSSRYPRYAMRIVNQTRSGPSCLVSRMRQPKSLDWQVNVGARAVCNVTNCLSSGRLSRIVGKIMSSIQDKHPLITG